MAKDSFPIRLHEARLMMRLSMEQLAKLTGGIITKQSISRYEKGIMHPKRDAQRALAQALNISEEYFKEDNLKIDMPMLRTASNGRLNDEQLKSIEAKLAFWSEQYLAKEREANYHTSFENPIKGITVLSMEDAIQTADCLRQQWHCGDGPIVSILRVLERKGIKILSAELPDGVLGLSTWADGQHPLIILDMRLEKTSTEQIRFTAAHELAHLLLTLPEGAELGVEKRCHKFASFFLFPRQTFIEEMGGENREELTLDEMIDLKEQYGVSIAAQVHEAWDLHMISREHYDWWYNERIHKNKKEIGWGHYPYPETIGREKRLNSIMNHIKNKEDCGGNEQHTSTHHRA